MIKLRSATGVSALVLIAAAAACAPSAASDDVATSSEALTSARYLMARGVGTEASANAYYASIIRGFAPGTYTLAQWLKDFVPQDAQLVTGFYRNTNDLGFWREMYCTDPVARGKGGCFVVNWKDEGDRAEGRTNLGTVAMNVSPDGFTRFYAFGPNGVLSPSVALDSEGPKFVPEVCTVCHAGSAPATAQGDLGSVFREFETSLLAAPSFASANQVEAQWRGLNTIARGANDAIRTEAAGSPSGTDFARQRLADHIDHELYAAPAASTSVALTTQALPSTWDLPSDPRALRAAKAALYRSVIAPSCMPCHRTMQFLDWASYPAFEPFGKRAGGAPSFLEQILAPDAQRGMPQAQLTANNLTANADAKRAIAAWLTAVNAVPAPN